MEDPIRFDVWGTILPAGRETALAVIREQGIYPSEIELRKAVVRALRMGEPIQVARALGYSAALDFLRESGHFLGELAISQEGWAPHERTGYCEKHRLHYGGCLGCHVCQDFYVE
jgi:hypothetical protein